MKDRITGFAAFFYENSKFTVLLFISILALGYLSYTSFLNREGFPSVNVPIAVVNTAYFAGDEQQVLEDVTIPLEAAISEIDGVTGVTSSTDDNFSNIFVEFEENVASADGAAEIENELLKVELPGAAQPMVISIDASKFDGQYDMLVSVAGDLSIEDLQKEASIVAEELVELQLISDADVLEQIATRTNPLTGEEFLAQDSFSRVGIRENGELGFKPAVAIGLVKKNGGIDAIELSDTVRERIAEVKEEGQLNEAVTIVYTGDIAEVVNSQISSLEENALSGLIAVVMVLFLVINWRSGLTAAVFIPTVMAATFLGLYGLGYTLNVISLFALILVLGLFVDDAIVVIEAIDKKKREGLKHMQAIKSALSDIGSADVLGTITTILVFLPMAFTSGILGEFIRLIPITVILALVLSLIIALTVIPFLADFLIRYSDKGEPKGWRKIQYYLLYAARDFVEFVGNKNSEFIGWYLASKLRTVAVILLSIVLVGVGFFYAGQIKFSVFPTPKDNTQLGYDVVFPPNRTIEDAEKRTQELENLLKKVAGEQIVSVSYLSANERSLSGSINLTEIDERDVTSTEIVDKLTEEFTEYDKARVKVTSAGAGPPAQEFPFTMQLFGDSSAELAQNAAKIEEFMLERELSGENRVEAVVVENLANVTREDSNRFVEIKARFSESENTGLVVELQDKIEEEFSDLEINLEYGQESENINSFNSTIFALLASLLMMYALLVLQYNSYLIPLLVFLAIPLSFTGVFPGLALTDNPLSFFTMLGVIGLAGIVVNNTIMLLDFIRQESDEKNLKAALASSIKLRFRPIVATTATTVAGLFPLALSDPFWESLSYTIIFGLIASSIIVLLAFPAYYYLTMSSASWLGKRLKAAGHRLGL